MGVKVPLDVIGLVGTAAATAGVAGMAAKIAGDVGNAIAGPPAPATLKAPAPPTKTR